MSQSRGSQTGRKKTGRSQAPADPKSREELRREHRAARQRQQKRRRRTFYVVLCLVVVVVGVVLSLTVFFNVSEVIVKGDSIYSSEEIISASGVSTGDNLFMLDRDGIKESIGEKLPFVGTVELRNAFPDKLVITVHDTSVKCAVEDDGGYVLINENGKVLGVTNSIEEIYDGRTSDTDKQIDEDSKKPVEEQEPENSQDKADSQDKEDNQSDENTDAEQDTAGKKTKFILGSEKVIILKGIKVKSAIPGTGLVVENERSFKLYAQIMEELSNNKITGITSIDLSSTASVELMYQDRIKIILGSVSNLKSKMALATNVLATQDEISPYQEGTIDLSIDKKAYFSPKHEDTTNVSGDVSSDKENPSQQSSKEENNTDASGKTDSSKAESENRQTSPNRDT